MTRSNFLLFSVVLLIPACAGTGNNNTPESRAEYHMNLASRFEENASVREAAVQYKIVAELYKRTSHYPGAVRNTALLYAHPLNKEMDDSTSLHWFETYLTLPIPKDERFRADIDATLLKRLLLLRKANTRRMYVVDSLEGVIKRQSSEILAWGNRVLELETQLQATTAELQRMADEFDSGRRRPRQTTVAVPQPRLEELEKLRADELARLREVDARINKRKEKQ